MKNDELHGENERTNAAGRVLRQSCYTNAVRMLSRREHAAHELYSKLKKKEFSAEEIEKTIAKCQELGLQSDVRFAESRCRVRMQQGYGPVRLRNELQYFKIDEAVIEAVLQAVQDDWQDIAIQVWRKKYKAGKAKSMVELQKQKNFLRYKGFTRDIIEEIFNNSCKS